MFLCYILAGTMLKSIVKIEAATLDSKIVFGMLETRGNVMGTTCNSHGLHSTLKQSLSTFQGSMRQGTAYVISSEIKFYKVREVQIQMYS